MGLKFLHDTGDLSALIFPRHDQPLAECAQPHADLLEALHAVDVRNDKSAAIHAILGGPLDSVFGFSSAGRGFPLLCAHTMPPETTLLMHESRTARRQIDDSGAEIQDRTIAENRTVKHSAPKSSSEPGTSRASSLCVSRVSVQWRARSLPSIHASRCLCPSVVMPRHERIRCWISEVDARLRTARQELKSCPRPILSLCLPIEDAIAGEQPPGGTPSRVRWRTRRGHCGVQALPDRDRARSPCPGHPQRRYR